MKGERLLVGDMVLRKKEETWARLHLHRWVKTSQGPDSAQHAKESLDVLFRNFLTQQNLGFEFQVKLLRSHI